MPNATHVYQPGYQGTAVIDGISYAVQGWDGDEDPGLWDATNLNTGGWMYQENGIRKVSINFTLIAKASQPATNGGAAVPAQIPYFKTGDTLPATFTINGTDAYAGSWIVTKRGPKVDLKGGVTFDCSVDSQGPLTGTLAIPPALPTGS